MELINNVAKAHGGLWDAILEAGIRTFRAIDAHWNIYCSLELGGFSVFAGVGERTREGNDLYREMIESGVIKLGEKQVNTMQFISPTELYYILPKINVYVVSFHC